MKRIQLTAENGDMFVVSLRRSEQALVIANIINQNAVGTRAEILPNEKPSGETIAQFHRERRCCDGSDPVKCWHDRNREEAERVKAAKEVRAEAKRRERDPRSEYEGTE